MSLADIIHQWNPFYKSTDAGLEPIFITLLATEVYKRIAVDSCINLIANALVRCEFKTLEKGKIVKKDNYYLFNIAPNRNQNATEFKKKLISKLYRENECLIVMANEQLFIADSFVVDEYVMKDSVYSQVTVGTFEFTGSFNESDVIYLKLNDKDIMQVINSFYKDYGSLLASAKDIYKRSNAKRFVLKGDFLRSQRNEEQKKIDDMMNAQFEPWLKADNAGAIFQLQKNYELEDVSGSGKNGVNKQDSRDIRSLVDDIFDFVATGFHIPRGLVKGDVVDVSSQTNNFLMFCVKPAVDLICTEFNKKMYGKELFLNGTYLKIDTTKIKVTDLNDMATALDKLFAIGALSINDIIEMTGGEKIDEDWADRRYVTKNYNDASQSQSVGGGDTE